MTQNRIQEHHGIDLSGLSKQSIEAIERILQKNAELEAKIEHLSIFIGLSEPKTYNPETYRPSLKDKIGSLEGRIKYLESENERLNRPPRMNPSTWRRDGF